jgi:hypothetical protein
MDGRSSSRAASILAAALMGLLPFQTASARNAPDQPAPTATAPSTAQGSTTVDSVTVTAP